MDSLSIIYTRFWYLNLTPAYLEVCGMDFSQICFQQSVMGLQAQIVLGTSTGSL